MYKTFTAAILLTVSALASSVTYDTDQTTLVCGLALNCTQNTAQQITIGGETLTYQPGSGTVLTPSIINFGFLDTSGTGHASLTGLILTIIVDSTPPGQFGVLPNGYLVGSITTNGSNSVILWGPNNTTTQFGHLPGVNIGPFTYQVLNTSLGIIPPTVGNPLGQTTIQADVVGSVGSVPEPVSSLLVGSGLLLAALRRIQG